MNAEQAMNEFILEIQQRAEEATKMVSANIDAFAEESAKKLSRILIPVFRGSAKEWYNLGYQDGLTAEKAASTKGKT